DRPRVAQLVGGGHAAAERAARPLVHLGRAFRALVEDGELPLRELLDALVVDLYGGRDGHRGSPSAAADRRGAGRLLSLEEDVLERAREERAGRRRAGRTRSSDCCCHWAARDGGPL